VCVRVFVLELRLYNIYTGEKAATALFFMGGGDWKKGEDQREKIFFAPLLQFSVKVLSEHFWDPQTTKTLVAS